VAVCGGCIKSALLFIVPTLDHKIVAYFDPGFQNILVHFFMFGTQEFSLTCIFLEYHRRT